VADHDVVWDLERAGWEALSTDGEVAGRFYDGVLADEPVFVLPGGLVLDDRDLIVGSMGGAAWDDHTLRDERIVTLGTGAVAVVYRAEAERGGQGYEALVTSTYVRDGGSWRLAVHQQTPL
jgi:hypothetical protein